MLVNTLRRDEDDKNCSGTLLPSQGTDIEHAIKIVEVVDKDTYYGRSDENVEMVYVDIGTSRMRTIRT